MNNAEWCLLHDIKFAGISVGIIPRRKGNFYKVLGNANGLGNREPIGMMPREQTGDMTEGESTRAFKQWLDLEHVDYKEPEDILTGEERGYLKNVIRPFRDDVFSLGKVDAFHAGIDIEDKDEMTLCFIPLKGRFNGMEEGKQYTPEELGLL